MHYEQGTRTRRSTHVRRVLLLNMRDWDQEYKTLFSTVCGHILSCDIWPYFVIRYVVIFCRRLEIQVDKLFKFDMKKLQRDYGS